MHVFGSFELDDQLYELRSNGVPVKLTPRVYDLLSYLVRNRNRVVPKEELIEQIQITLRHEIGHYLGLDENDLERLGLA